MEAGKQFQFAVAAIFGQDPAQRHAANLWLDSFSKTTDAWGCALSMLDPSCHATAEQRFFAANLLASKTRNEWGGLSAQQRSQLSDAFGAVLRGLLLPPSAASSPIGAAALTACQELVLLERVVRLAAVSAVLSGLPSTGQNLALAQELALAAQSALAPGAPEAYRAGGEALLRCSLLVLQLLAEEAEALDSGRRKALLSGSADGQGDGLTARRLGIVALLRDVLAAAATGSGSDGPNFVLLLAAVRCLAAWVRLDESGCADGGLSPGQLQAMAPGLLPSILSLLSLPPPGPPVSSPMAASPAATRQHQPAIALYAAVADFAADLLGPGVQICPAAAGGEAADVAAVAAAVELLICTGHQLAAAAAGEVVAAATAATASGTGCGESCRGSAVAALAAWIRVAVTVAERNAGGLASGPGEGAVQLAYCVVAAWVACPGQREVSDICTDYFLAINTVPTAQRHPALAAPLYGALLPLVQQAVSYPPGFEDWESEVDVEEEAFQRFREHQAADLLDSIWGQCRTAMVGQLLSEITAGPSRGAAAGSAGMGRGVSNSDWRSVEAALFCLRAIHIPVKAAAMGGRAGELNSPRAASTAVELQAHLGRLFADVCSSSGGVASLLSIPWVCLSVSRLVGDYAAWLGKAPDAPLQAAMGLLLRALTVPSASSAAALAFRNCCIRGADRLTSDPPALAALAQAAMATVAPPPPHGAAAVAVPLNLEERSWVVEGLSRLAAALPAEAAAEAGAGLMAPCVARAQSVAAAGAAAGGPLPPAALAALAVELGVMTAVVRFLEPPGPQRGLSTLSGTETAVAMGTAHPAMRALQVAWPVLSAVASEAQCQRDPEVVEALAELYKRSLLSTKLAGRPLLPPLISSLRAVLRVCPHSAVLDCLGTVVELFGEVAHSGETRAAQVAALEGSVQMMGALVAGLPALRQKDASGSSTAHPLPSSSSSSSSPGELAASFFNLVDRFLIFARELMLQGEGAETLPALVEWACEVLVTMREREPAAAVLSFLTHLLAAAARLAAEENIGSGEGGRGGSGPQDAMLKADGGRARLDSLFGRCGPRLVHSLLVAGVDTCPLQLSRPLAGCLMGMMALADAGSGTSSGGVESELRRGLPEWLRSCWQLPPLAELLQRGRLGPAGEHARLFTELLLRGHYPPLLIAATTGSVPSAAASSPAAAAATAPPPLPRGRLDALVSDFFHLARGEADDDVMLGYQL